MLTEAVMEEVNSWYITLKDVRGHERRISPKVKHLLYGPAIDVTTKVMESYNEKRLTDLPLQSAEKEFMKAYLQQQLNRAQGDARQAAEYCGVDYNNYRQYKFQYGAGKPEPPKGIEDLVANDLKKVAIDAIESYKGAFSYSLDRLLQEKSEDIAERLCAVAIENSSTIPPVEHYQDMPIKDAKRQFKRDYLVTQLNNHGYDCKAAATASGQSYGGYRAALFHNGISIRELRKSMSSV
jgi:hypothetical protein